LESEDWWQQVHDTAEEMIDNISDAADWVLSSQITTPESSFTYKILNAWALSMGLDPGPTFAPNGDGIESFLIRAQHIFDLALEDALTWKMLLSFSAARGS
jgi:hypothetical protein